jgi:hypothetical protein
VEDLITALLAVTVTLVVTVDLVARAVLKVRLRELSAVLVVTQEVQVLFKVEVLELVVLTLTLLLQT